MRGRPGRYNVPDVMRGPRFTSTPRQEPPPLASFVSQLGPPFCGPSAEPVRWVRGGAFKISAPRFRPPDKDDVVPRVRKADGGKCEGGPVGTTYNRR
jgi:hypothetical protein